jgi:hypothetical protein
VAAALVFIWIHMLFLASRVQLTAVAGVAAAGARGGRGDSSSSTHQATGGPERRDACPCSSMDGADIC